MELIDGGAEDFVKGDEISTVYTTFDNFGNMQKKLSEMNLEVRSAEVQQIPKTTTALPLAEAQEVLAIIEKFEEDDDVNTVYHNLELTEELIEKLS